MARSLAAILPLAGLLSAGLLSGGPDRSAAQSAVDRPLPASLCAVLARRPDLALALGIPLADADARTAGDAPVACVPIPEESPGAMWPSDRPEAPDDSAPRPRLPPFDPGPAPPRPGPVALPGAEAGSGTGRAESDRFPSEMRLRTRRALMRSEPSLIERTKVEQHNRAYKLRTDGDDAR